MRNCSNPIKRQVEVLNSNGVVCHSFWKGEGTEIFKGMFVNYHSEAELRSLFEPSFDILLLESYQEFEADDSLADDCQEKLIELKQKLPRQHMADRGVRCLLL